MPWLDMIQAPWGKLSAFWSDLHQLIPPISYPQLVVPDELPLIQFHHDILLIIKGHFTYCYYRKGVF